MIVLSTFHYFLAPVSESYSHLTVLLRLACVLSRATLPLVVSCRVVLSDRYLLLPRDDLAGMIESNTMLQLEKVQCCY